MCGIIGYIGPGPALPHLIEGLKRLEYRGYDSAGVVLSHEGDFWLRKTAGRVADLEAHVEGAPGHCMGIAHTRWATHGGVTDENAHPHLDEAGRVAVVHNGIIENATALRKELTSRGVTFISETDTEIIAHLIARAYEADPLEAVRVALRQIRGTYGLVVLFADHPEMMVAARHGSPLVIGLGEEETVVASDPQAVVAHSRNVRYLRDRELAVITRNAAEVEAFDGGEVHSAIEVLDGEYSVAELDGFPHFMLQEIHEQPRSIRRCLRGRLKLDEGNAVLGGLMMPPRDLVGVQRVINLGCGTSYHAGMAGAMVSEALARVPARAEIASEFRYRHPIVPSDALFFAISQSGETADTLGAVLETQLKGGQVVGVVNVVGSTIARVCGRGTYVHSGPEVAVASTKAFTSQVTALLLFNLMLGRTRNLSLEKGRRVAKALDDIPDLVARYLENPGPIEGVVEALVKANYTLFLGRGYSYPVALEGALKLKEVAYIPCEGYPAGEMKHGPIAMLEEGTPVVCVAPADEQRQKVLSNLREVQARGARLVVIHTEGDEELAELSDFSIPVPKTISLCSPLLTVVPLQLIAYQAGLALGRDVDKPRNLAKSVTVE